VTGFTECSNQLMRGNILVQVQPHGLGSGI
jgi:hypothetical protein